MKLLHFSNGKHAIIDDEDYDLVNGFTWTYAKSYESKWTIKEYAFRSTSRKGGQKRKRIYLHRMLIDAPAGIQVDHVNGNGLDCQRHNIRLATPSQNQGNQKVSLRPKYSKYKGVTWYKDIKKWGASIKDKGKQKHLGLFTNEVLAARAYDEAAKRVFGHFSLTNAA